ncbi:MAG: hypothetical protein HYV03_05455 [Deltaproteobacteria bacterium]|nr:hypothetical protein [Deltaproteobacteria bacterium]
MRVHAARASALSDNENRALPLEMSLMHRHVVVAMAFIGLVACIAIAVFILPRNTEHVVSVKRGGIYRIVIPPAPIVLDPIRSNWPLSLQLLHAINATLVRVDANGNIVPHIAASWTVDSERKLYRFRIRDDVHFHNGKNVTVDDVIGSLKRTLNPESLYRDNLRMVVGYDNYIGAAGQDLEGIRKLGPSEFEIALQYPFEPFLTMLTSISFSVLLGQRIFVGGL